MSKNITIFNDTSSELQIEYNGQEHFIGRNKSIGLSLSEGNARLVISQYKESYSVPKKILMYCLGFLLGAIMFLLDEGKIEPFKEYCEFPVSLCLVPDEISELHLVKANAGNACCAVLSNKKSLPLEVLKDNNVLLAEYREYKKELMFISILPILIMLGVTVSCIVYRIWLAVLILAVICAVIGAYLIKIKRENKKFIEKIQKNI